MPAWLESWPFVWIYLFFVSGAAMRSQALYWLGRGVATGSLRSGGRSEPAAGGADEPIWRRLLRRWVRVIDGPGTRRAVRAIERWGMPIVPLSFLTVGFQSAVHGSCGLLRLQWWRYTLWSVPGWFAWALVWAGGGTAALYGAALLAARSPWALGAVVVLVAGGAIAALLHRRRRRDAQSAVDALGAGGGDRTGHGPGATPSSPVPSPRSAEWSERPSEASTAPPYRRSRRA